MAPEATTPRHGPDPAPLDRTFLVAVARVARDNYTRLHVAPSAGGGRLFFVGQVDSHRERQILVDVYAASRSVGAVGEFSVEVGAPWALEGRAYFDGALCVCESCGEAEPPGRGSCGACGAGRAPFGPERPRPALHVDPSSGHAWSPTLGASAHCPRCGSHVSVSVVVEDGGASVRAEFLGPPERCAARVARRAVLDAAEWLAASAALREGAPARADSALADLRAASATPAPATLARAAMSLRATAVALGGILATSVGPYVQRIERAREQMLADTAARADRG